MSAGGRAHGSLPRLEGDRAGWVKKFRTTLRFLLPTSGEAIPLDFVQHAQFIRREAHRACLRCRRRWSWAFVITKSWTERGLLPKAIARRLAGRRAISTGWVLIRTRPAGSR